jgi:hypothetical protein
VLRDASVNRPRDAKTVARNSDVVAPVKSTRKQFSIDVPRRRFGQPGPEGDSNWKAPFTVSSAAKAGVVLPQPKVIVAGAKMVSAEALMRWRAWLGVSACHRATSHPARRRDRHGRAAQRMGDPRGRPPGPHLARTGFGFADSITVNLPNRLFERTDLVRSSTAAVTTYGVPPCHRAPKSPGQG